MANGAPRISHIFFADDSYLYCKATMNEVNRLQELLQKFEEASGQKVNHQKSSIFFSTNTAGTTRQLLCAHLGMQEASRDNLYLGLPSTLGRNKTTLLGFLKDRVCKRLQSWKGKFLSRAGKEILVKTVAQSLPTYAMNVFLLPLEITRERETLMNRYWWTSSNGAKSGIHWMAWNRLCKHKNMGGMGFRNLRDFNFAMLGKQGWRLMTQPLSLAAQMFKARYFPHGSFLTAQLGTNPSFVWRSIWEAQSFLRKGVK